MPRRPGPPSPAQLDPTPPPRVHLARDHPWPSIRANVSSGEWSRVRRGVYAEHPAGLTRYAGERCAALARIAAVEARLQVPHALSHVSAAVLWGLPLVGTAQRTHVIQEGTPTTAGTDDLVRHVHPLPEEHRTVHHGYSVTTLERTLVDCAMLLDPRQGLILADAGLHVGADRDGCLDILAGMRGRRGVRRARTVLDLADGGSESPGETSARFVFLRAGLPAPETQVRVRTHLGDFWSDLGWPAWRALAEYDGAAKYAAQGDAAGAVLDEKRREDAIIEAGWRVIRITASDLRSPDVLVRRVVRLAPPGVADRLHPRRELNLPGRRQG